MHSSLRRARLFGMCEMLLETKLVKELNLSSQSPVVRVRVYIIIWYIHIHTHIQFRITFSRYNVIIKKSFSSSTLQIDGGTRSYIFVEMCIKKEQFNAFYISSSSNLVSSCILYEIAREEKKSIEIKHAKINFFFAFSRVSEREMN